MSHIHSVAMLASFNVSQWTARKVDKAKSAELTDTNKANSKLAHVSKKLVKCEELDGINKLVTSVREKHKALTSPWTENGARILSAMNYRPYRDMIEENEKRFWPLVNAFVRSYPAIRDSAAAEYSALGQLFSLRDYPAADRIAAKFAWHSEIFEIPNEADFRVDIGDSEVARIRADIEATNKTRFANATVDMFERVHEVVSTMANGLSEFQPEKTGKDRGIFRDSLVTNVADLVAALPGLNFTGDARVQTLIEDMKALIVAPEALRLDNALRADVTAKAKDMIEAVSLFMA